MSPPGWLSNTALALGIVSCLPGINSLLRPTNAVQTLMLPKPAQPAQESLAHALTRMDGGRRLASGLTTIILWQQGAYEAMAYCALFCGTLVASVDGWPARGAGSAGNGWEHWIFVPVSAGVGYLLLKVK